MDTGLSGNCGSWAADHAFKVSYSGTLQQGDDLRIPVDSKKVPAPVSKMKVELQGTQTGVDVDFSVYRDGVLIDTLTVPNGDFDAELDITPTVIDPDEKITWAITWSGRATQLGITATMRLTT